MLLLAAMLGSASARAATLAEWDVAAANAAVAAVVEVASTAPFVSAEPLVAHGALEPAFAAPATFEFLSWPTAAAPDPSKYYEFSIAPAPGSSIQFQSLALAVGSGGVGASMGAFQISASLDGFATPGQVLAAETFLEDTMWHAFELDLSALGTQASEVTFRFAMYQVTANAFSGLGVNPMFGGEGRNLVVSGTVFEGETPPGCVPAANTLCIDDIPGDRRFQARVSFETTQGSMPAGPGRAIPLNSLGIPSGGVFWFTSAQNPEMLIKVLNGCSFNQHYWVFYAAGTNFALRTEVIDTATGRAWVRTNPDRTQAPPVGDLLAFPCGAQGQIEMAELDRSGARAALAGAPEAWIEALESWSDPDGASPRTVALEPREACSPNASTLCIDDQPGDGRFEATVFFHTTQGSQPTGFGTAIPLASVGVPSGGIFWFTNPENPEMLLKVLNGCSFNQHYWVFYAAGTNFGLEVEVIDTATNTAWTSFNPDRSQAPPIGDIVAFPCQAP